MRRWAALLVLALLAVPVAAQLQQAPWTEGPVSQGVPGLADGLPYGEGRHFRVLLRAQLPSALAGAADVPAAATVDLAAALREAAPEPYPSLPTGQLKGFELDTGSLRLIEVGTDDAGRLLPLPAKSSGGRARPEPLLWHPGSFTDPRPFDARLNPVVTLSWILDGPTTGPRTYLLYFDAVHNGRKQPDPTDTAAVAATVGPGRGSLHYISLHAPLSSSATANDPRFLRITNLQDAPAKVTLYRYDRGESTSNELAEVDVPGGVGQTALFRFPSVNPYGETALLADAGDALVSIEAASSVAMADGVFTPGTGRLFLPAAEGGFVGRRFAETPQAGVSWLVLCPGSPVNAADCAVQLGGGAPLTVRRDDVLALRPAAGAPAVLQATAGRVAVERVPDMLTPSNAGLLAWPPLDGPGRRSLYMGHAVQSSPTDRLLLWADGPAATLSVRSLAGASPRLASNLEVPARSLLTEAQGAGWGTAWNRDWRLGNDARRHEDGPALVRAQGAGLGVVSGLATQANGASFLVPLQSPDGGLSYSAVIPESNGLPVGRLVLFALHEGTNVILSHLEPGSSSPTPHTLRPLRAGQFKEAASEPGWWSLRADRPVVAAWQQVGSVAFSAQALGRTDVAQVDVLGAQLSGYLFDLEAPASFKPARPDSRVEFTVPVRNLAADVEGKGVRDRVQFAAKVPPGWPPATVVPSTLDLGAFEASEVTVKVDVPDGVDASSGGATVTLQGTSAHVPGLRIEADLRISFIVQRGVQVTGDGVPGELQKALGQGEAASILLQVTNTGSVPDAFQVQYSLPPAGWRLDVVCLFPPPCPADGEGKTPLLAQGASAQMLLQVSPLAASSQRLVTRILATSLFDPSTTGSFRLVTFLPTDRQFTLEVAEPTRVVEPGGEAVFQVLLRNLGEGEEEIHLDLQTQRPPGWEQPRVRVTLAGSSTPTDLAAVQGTVNIPPGGTVALELAQRVPADAPPLQVALNRLLGESTIDSTGASAEAPLRTVVQEVRGLTIRTPDALTGAPDATIPLPVTLTSLGNGEQDVELRLSAPGFGWEAALAGKPLPATVRLAARQTLSVPLELRVPHDALPLEAGGNLLAVRAEVPGADPAVNATVVVVAANPGLEAEAGPWALQRGRSNNATATLRNTGNVDLRLTATLSHGLLGEHELAVLLPRGATRTVTFQVPAPTALPDGTARLVVRSSGGLARELEVPFRSGTPALAAAVLGLEPLEGGLQVLRVRVENRGDTAAYGVWVAALRGAQELDRLPLGSLRPGGNGTVNLVVKEGGTDGLAVRVVADHDPDGVLVPASPPQDRSVPLPAAAALLGVLLAAAWRRRR